MARSIRVGKRDARGYIKVKTLKVSGLSRGVHRLRLHLVSVTGQGC